MLISWKYEYASMCFNCYYIISYTHAAAHSTEYLQNWLSLHHKKHTLHPFFFLLKSCWSLNHRILLFSLYKIIIIIMIRFFLLKILQNRNSALTFDHAKRSLYISEEENFLWWKFALPTAKTSSIFLSLRYSMLLLLYTRTNTKSQINY